MSPSPPLNVLLAHALLDLTRACEREGAAEVVLWSNLLRVLDEDGVSGSSLPAAVRLSKRAVTSTRNCVRRRQWIDDDGGVVRLTRAGRTASDEWAAAIGRAEQQWPHTSSVRHPLEVFVASLPLEHPHYPCGYGTADWRISGGPGVDWKPVPRDPDGDTVSASSTLALLAQALVGFTVEYESRVPFALLVGVHLDAAFADDAIELTDAPPALAITGKGTSSLERHGAVVVRGSRASLTSTGRAVRDRYRPTVDAVESSFAAAPDLRCALETCALGGAGHAAHPDVRWVGGDTGFAEVSAR